MSIALSVWTDRRDYFTIGGMVSSPAPLRRLIAAFVSCAVLGAICVRRGVYAQDAPTPDDAPTVSRTEHPPAVPLVIEVEGLPILVEEDVHFYGPRVPRSHYEGSRPISEREFFTIVGDTEAMSRSRNHRALNIALGALSVTTFFSGLVLFGAADDVDWTMVGLPGDTPGRTLSLSLMAGSVGPAILIAVRGQQWATLEYSFRSARRHNARTEPDEDG